MFLATVPNFSSFRVFPEFALMICSLSDFRLLVTFFVLHSFIKEEYSLWTEVVVLTGWLSLGSELSFGSLRVQHSLAAA